jgi:hypothetical protein
MFRSEKSVGLLQAVAAIAGLAVLLWSLGLPSIRIADAASVTDFSDTLSDSATSTAAYHEIQYVIPNGSAGVESGESINITFPPEFTGTSTVTLADLDLDISGSDQTLVDSGAAVNQWEWDWNGGNTLTFLSGGGTAIAAANATVTIQIGSNAAGGTDRLVNPSTVGSYEIDVVSGDGGNNDSGTTQVVILAPVKITASVDTTFDFTVAGVAGGQTVNGSTTDGGTTATSIPFGTLSNGNATTTAQDLTVSTNASQGYTVTVQVDHTLLSSTGADIDLFNDNDTPALWAAPTPSIGDENTWGYWGITSEDGTTTRSSEFTAGTWIGATTTGRIVMGHDGPADATTQGAGAARIGFRAEITSLQEAGDDYEAILTYIATPTF